MLQRYHTNLKIKYKLGLLQPETDAMIPNSTKQYWKKQDFYSYLGVDDPEWDKGLDTLKFVCQRKTLFRLIRVVKYVEETARLIFDSLENKGQVLRKFTKEIVYTIDKIRSFIGFQRALEIFKITSHQYWYWKKSSLCVASPLKLCRKVYYNQLSTLEVSRLKACLFDPNTLHWPLISRYYQMLRRKTGYMGLTTFYKYARLLEATAYLKRKNKSPKAGLRAVKPLQIIHTDLTEIRIRDRLKIYVSFVVDNYSRYILGWKMSTSKTSGLTCQNLEEVYNKYLSHLPEVKLIADGGSENKGLTDVFIKSTPIQKLVAQTDIVFSNSMVEAINKKMKYEYWLTPSEYDFESFEKLTGLAVEEYNERPHGMLKGLTPFEALYAKEPTDYAPEIKLAAQQRQAYNKTAVCGLCDIEEP